MAVSYDDGLVLAATHIKHDQVSRDAVITYAVNDQIPAEAQAYADGLQDAFADAFKGHLDTGAQISKTIVLRGEGGSIFTTGESTAAGVYGTLAQSSLPSNCAVLCKKITGFGGRTSRGRMYMPWWIPESDVGEDNRFGGAALADRQSDCDDWLADVNSRFGAATLCIANREYDLPWDNPNRKLQAVHIGLDVTAVIVDPLIATQRRRIGR